MDARLNSFDLKQLFQPVVTALKWLWSVFFSLLVIFTFVATMYFTGAKDTWLWLNAKSWEQTECEIDQVYSGRQERMKSGSSSGSISFKVSAAYRYRDDYGKYYGNRYDFKGIFRSSYQGVKKDLEYLRSHSSVPCYYNPRNPEQSVINRGFQKDFLFMLIPLFTLGLFAYMALRVLLGAFGIKLAFGRKKKRFLP